MGRLFRLGLVWRLEQRYGRSPLTALLTFELFTTMADDHDLDAVREHLVDDPVRGFHQFAQERQTVLGNDAPRLWEQFKLANTLIQRANKAACGLTRVRRQARANRFHRRGRQWTPDNPHPAARSRRMTSSCGIPFPSRSSCRAFWISARSSSLRGCGAAARSNNNTSAWSSFISSISWCSRSFVDMWKVYYPTSARSAAAAVRTCFGAVPPGTSRSASAESTVIASTSSAKSGLSAA